MISLEKFTIHSSANPDRVREKLLEVVEPRLLFWDARNIDGRITPEGTGSKIEISMSLNRKSQKVSSRTVRKLIY